MLIGITDIAARNANNSLVDSFILTTLSNLDIIINDVQDSGRMTWDLDANMWNSSRIPASVVPGFDCGNIRLSYELEIKLGVGVGDINVSIDASVLGFHNY